MPPTQHQAYNIILFSIFQYATLTANARVLYLTELPNRVLQSEDFPRNFIGPKLIETVFSEETFPAIGFR